MASGPSISVRGISKAYRLGVIGRRTLQDELAYWWHRVRGRNPLDHMGVVGYGTEPGAHQDGERISKGIIWALRDVSMDVEPGEIVGLIGRNGAGKTTLLKILSRITEPTTGEAVIDGRVGSLLQVGTGFHPELTGRENVYLNGTILGMKKQEVNRRFDEIVAFSEIEEFIDTPVKRYSSGMFVRLAFAVAAHLSTEILLIDEVLAVGDAAFQKKCLGKMDDVAQSGRTILFVSHQMNAIRALCTRCLWMDQGRLIGDGATEDIVGEYLKFNVSEGEWRADPAAPAHRNAYFSPLRFGIVDENLQPVSRDIRADEAFGLVVEGNVERVHPSLCVGFEIVAATGETALVTTHTDTEEDRWPAIERGRNRLVVRIPPHTLNEGFYRVELKVSLYQQERFVRPGYDAPSVALHVQGGLSNSPHWIRRRRGLTAPILPFERV